MQPLWITDNVLAEAFHRFVNVSNAIRKRHGSNVPGPLESRRRLAKRRMMGLTAAGPAIGPDLGALFSVDRPADQGWRWEAPGAAEQPSKPKYPRAPQLPRRLSDPEQAYEPAEPRTSRSSVVMYQRSLSEIRTAYELDKLWRQIGVEPRQALRFSQMACTHFIERLGEGNSKGNRDGLFEFLRNPRLNIPEAQNMKTFVRYAATRVLPRPSLRMLIARIRESLLLGNMLQSELEVVVDTIGEVCAQARAKPEDVESWQFGAYWAMWRGMSECKVSPIDKIDLRIIRKMAERVLALPDPPPIKDIEKLRKLHVESHIDPVLFRLELYSHAWSTVGGAKGNGRAAHLASLVHSLSRPAPEEPSFSSHVLTWDVIIKFLDSLPADKARRLMVSTTEVLLDKQSELSETEDINDILRPWIASLSRTHHLSSFGDVKMDTFFREHTLTARIDPVMLMPLFRGISVLDVGRLWARHWLPHYVAQEGVRAATWNKVSQDFEKLFNSRITGTNSISLEKSRAAPFFHAIRALVYYNMPYKIALSKAAELVLAMYGPVSAHYLFRMIRAKAIRVRDPRTFAPTVESMSETEPINALRMFRDIPRMWLSLCPKLPLALILHNSLPREELFMLLDRNDPANFVSRAERTTVTNRLSALRTDLIHIIAYAYANQPNRPSRQRFRNVYYCYLYLRDRRAPLGPLLSKAFVRAGVTSALENFEWVSTVKLEWIMRFVRELEGDEVAKRLDQLVWQWRGEVIRESYVRWRGVGYKSPSKVVKARGNGLFDHDYPKRKSSYRRTVMGGVWRYEGRVRWMKRARPGTTWGRLPRRHGGKDGSRRPWKVRKAIEDSEWRKGWVEDEEGMTEEESVGDKGWFKAAFEEMVAKGWRGEPDDPPKTWIEEELEKDPQWPFR